MISTTVSRNNYSGPGAGPFPFNYKIFSYADLLVTKRSATGTETTLAYGQDFTATGVNVEAGGSITLTVALLVGEVVSIRRVPALLQKTSLQNQSFYYGSTHESEFDTLLMQVQAVMDGVSRSFKLAESSDPSSFNPTLPTPAATQLLGWDALGSKLINYNPAFKDAVVQTFTNGVDFTSGVTTQLTLSSAPGTFANLLVVFDGVWQDHTKFSLNTATITFNNPIVATKVEVQYRQIVDAGITANLKTNPFAVTYTDTTASSIAATGLVSGSFTSSNIAGTRSSATGTFGSVNHNAAGAATTLAGAYGSAQASAGSVTRLEAVAGAIYVYGGTHVNTSGLVTVSQLLGGTVTTASSLRSEGIIVNGGTVSNLYGLKIDGNTLTGGTITGVNYGIKVEDQNIAGITNIALQTGLGTVILTGAVQFGSTLQISGAATFNSGLVVTAGDASFAGTITLATNLQALRAKTTAGPLVNVFKLTNDANNISRFISGVTAGGFQWTDQLEANAWMVLTASQFALGAGVQLQTQGGTFLQTLTALTNNAAAATATLTNAPVAGNPTKWIPINDFGVIRNIPCW